MKNVATFVIVCLIGIAGLMGCVASAGLAFQKADEVTDSQSLQAQAAEAEAEADRAEAEAAEAEAEAEAEQARAEAERARVEQIRAEGERAEARASAYVERKIGEEAAKAIRRQGRLLSWYVLRDTGRGVFMGAVLGVALVVNGLLIWVVIKRERGKVSDD